MKQKVADVRENLSPELLYAAFHFAELTKTVEKNKIPNQIELLNHRSYVIASVFSAVSFIEANINELFEKSEDKIHGAYGISKEVKEKLFPIYNLEMFKRGAKTLEKYETALLLLKQKKMEQGAKKYQDVKYLIELRNAFIHFKPELIGLYIEPDLSDLQDLEKKLSNRFTENPYTKPVPVISIANQGKRAEYPFFPERCFSYSCARWACISSMIFADSFYKEIDMKPLYETIKKGSSKTMRYLCRALRAYGADSLVKTGNQYLRLTRPLTLRLLCLFTWLFDNLVLDRLGVPRLRRSAPPTLPSPRLGSGATS